MFNKGQLAGLMKQAQAMQDNLKKAQEELATIEVEGESGAGLDKVVMTCKHDDNRVSNDPSLLAHDKDIGHWVQTELAASGSRPAYPLPDSPSKPAAPGPGPLSTKCRGTG